MLKPISQSPAAAGDCEIGSSVITAMVTIVAITALGLMLYLTVEICRGQARPEDKEEQD